MARARAAILAAGGARRSNVFTRILLALWGEVPWRAVPVMPVEIMLLPRWFPFHLNKISYWSRVVVLPEKSMRRTKNCLPSSKLRVRSILSVPGIGSMFGSATKSI